MSPVVARQPAKPKRVPAVRVRRSIWTLEQDNTWDPITLAYATAVGAMQQKPASDPTSWEAQAQIHGQLCQHQSWYFLPWHRMYILWFERIVREHVKQQGGPANWALPYWNWQANRVLPPAFREQNLPASAGGGPNPLFVSQRNASINNGVAMAPAVVDSTAADAKIAFSEGAGSGFGFGGGARGPAHFDGGQTGRIESQPHNNVHVTVGGTMMSALSSRDPIFWLHHAMVDRLWVKWLAKGGGRANPSDSSWLDQQFSFTKPDGQPVTQKCSDVLSTRNLGYRYDDQFFPFRPLLARARPLADFAFERMEAVGGGGGEPQEVGASSGPIKLGADATTESIELADTPAADFSLLESADAGPRSVALVLDGIEVDDPETPAYEVYLNVPDEVEGGRHDSRHFVGFLEFFGADHAHSGGDDQDAEHSHGALKRVFDITGIVYGLEQEGAWDPSKVQVSFVPAKVFEDVETGQLLPPPIGDKPPSVTVGSVRVVSE